MSFVEMTAVSTNYGYGTTGPSGGGGAPPPMSRQNTRQFLPVPQRGRAVSGTVPKGESDGSSWRDHLLGESTRVSRALKKKVAALHQQVKNTNVRATCQFCGVPKYTLDLVTFNCVQHRRGGDERQRHRFCTDCIKVFAKGSGPSSCPDSAAVLAQIGDLCRQKMHLVVCPTCRCPNVLVSAIRFNPTFDRDRVDSRLQFTVHLGASQVVSENFSVDRVCENQRRPFFGAFSRENLLVVDFCGTISTEREMNASEIENVETTYERPNRSWAWLDDWSPDLSQNARGGWFYARDFTTPWPRAWSKEVQMLMFVRRRVLVRTRVRFNDEVRRALAGYFDALDGDANDTDA